MKGEVVPVSVDALVGEAAKKKVEGHRFVTMSCTELDGTMVDILYHFDKDLELTHLRLTVARDIPVPSLSPVYFAAFLVENEIQDLFGVRFKGLAVDYDRTLFLDEEVEVPPFCRKMANKNKEEEPLNVTGPDGEGESWRS
jgi:ech hydrogenase subunit D